MLHESLPVHGQGVLKESVRLGILDPLQSIPLNALCPIIEPLACQVFSLRTSQPFH